MLVATPAATTTSTSWRSDEFVAGQEGSGFLSHLPTPGIAICVKEIGK